MLINFLRTRRVDNLCVPYLCVRTGLWYDSVRRAVRFAPDVEQLKDEYEDFQQLHDGIIAPEEDGQNTADRLRHLIDLELKSWKMDSCSSLVVWSAVYDLEHLCFLLTLNILKQFKSSR